MKKISVVLLEKDVEEGLHDLAKAGVLHIEHFTVPTGEHLAVLQERHSRLLHVLAMLSLAGSKPAQEWTGEPEQVLESIEAAIGSLKVWEQRTRDLQAQISKWEPWGEFELHDILALEKAGLHVRLVTAPEAVLAVLPDDCMVERVGQAEGLVRAVVCSPRETLPGLEGATLPEDGPGRLRALLANACEEKALLKERLEETARFVDALSQHARRLEYQIAYQQAIAGRLVDDALTVVRGYCPVDAVHELERTAKSRQWGYLVEDPADTDQVPTLLRNPKWVDLIKPVFAMINVLPGYREHDISPVFLLFFSLFFGMLIGDAAYGIGIAALTAAAHWKLRRKLADKTPFHLMYVLAAMTIVWGVLTGTFLGTRLFPGIQALIPWLADASHIEDFCFFLGALHLSVAHVWRLVLKWPSPAVLAEVGWLCMLWGMFFLAEVLVLGKSMPDKAVYLFIAGPALIALFTSPSRNVFKSLGSGLASLAMNAVNTFTDVVSYIRLFAVGMATVAVADAFNEMAMGLGYGSVLAGVVTTLILVAGHAFNMVLGAMAILVHGLRLNVLEFSSHMNLEWAGIGYNPLRKP